MATPSESRTDNETRTAAAGATTYAQSPPADSLVKQGGALLPLQTAPDGAPTGSRRPSILNVAPKPIDLLKALQRRWLLALTLAFCIAVPPTMIAWFSIPVSYTATTWLRTGGRAVLFPVKNAAESNMQTHVQLIKSYMVLNAALSEPGIADLPWIREQEEAGHDVADWLGARIVVSAPSKRWSSEIMRISMSGDDPQQLPKLVTAVTNAYLERVVGEEKKGLLKRRDLLEKTYRRKSEEVRKKREDLHDLASEIGTADAETATAQQQLLMDHTLYLRREANSVRQQYLRTSRELRAFEQRVGWSDHGGAVLPEDIEEEILGDPELAQFDERVLAGLQQLDAYQKVIRDRDAPQLVGMRDEIEQLRKEKQARLDKLRAEILDAIRRGERKSEVQQTHERLSADVKELQQYHQELAREYDALTEDVQKLGEYSADLLRRREELSHLAELTGTLGYELEKLQLELSAGSSDRVRLLQAPRVPRTANSSRRDKLTGMVLFVGLALAIGGTSLIEFHHRRVTSSEEMAEGLGIRVMGSVPMLTERHWRFGRATQNGDAASDMQGTMDESIDGVRAMLLHAPESQTLRTLMVTSAKAGEGKTTVACSLAASMGRSGRRTLLIDGDLRRPSVHRLLDMPLDEGFAELLRGETAVEDVIRPSRATGLWFMSAGHCDHTSLQALTKDGVGQIFEKLRSEFDFIIVDTAPVLAVVDPLLLGQHCDGAMLSVIRRVSQMSAVHDTRERLKSTGIDIVGCIVNGLHGNPFTPGYYSYAYGYGYGSYGNGQPETEAAAETPAT